MAQHYLCAECGKEYTQKDVQVDHIVPARVDGFKTWDDFIERLFCGIDNLQVLCVPCHKEKSKQERKTRGTKSKRPE